MHLALLKNIHKLSSISCIHTIGAPITVITPLLHQLSRLDRIPKARLNPPLPRTTHNAGHYRSSGIGRYIIITGQPPIYSTTSNREKTQDKVHDLC